MAAIIRFTDGFEAKLLNEDGEWECADEKGKKLLEMWSDMFEYEGVYAPDMVAAMAEFVAKKAGAEVVHVDPMPKDNNPPGTIY